MIVRLWIVAAVAILGVALGGCADDPRPITPPVAEPETVGKMADDGAEQTDARRGGTGEETTFDNGLECPGGMAVSGTIDYAGAEGKQASLVEQTRRAFSGQIQEGDRVGLSTAPQRGDQRTVRVAREGRTVALVVYRRAGGGWLRDSYEACAGF